MAPTILYLSADPDLDLLLGERDANVHPQVIVEVDPAHALARAETDAIDCVVTDNDTYSDDDGTPFVTALSDNTPETPVVVYATSGPASNEQTLLDAGAAAFNWQTIDPDERRRIREEILELAQQSGQSRTERAWRLELEQLIELSDDAFAVHDFVNGRDISYVGLENLVPEDDSPLSLESAFELIHEGDRPDVFEKNGAVMNKEPWAFDSFDGDFGTFSEPVRIRKADGRIAYCMMRGAVAFDGDQPVKMYNTLKDVTAEVEYDWKTRSEQLLLENETDQQAATDICQELVEQTDCDGAWVTRMSATGADRTHVLFAATGDHAAYIDDRHVSPLVKELAADAVEPVNTAVDHRREPTVQPVDRIQPLVRATSGPDKRWFVAAPIVRNDNVFGVLMCMSRHPPTDVFERLLQSLASSLAYRYELEAHRRALHADSVAKAVFELSPSDYFLGRVARELALDDNGRIHARELETQADGTLSMLLTAPGYDSDEHVLGDAVGQFDAITDVSALPASESEATVVVVADATSINKLLTPHSAAVRKLSATSSSISLVVEAPGQANLRDLLDTVHEQFPSATLSSRVVRARELSTPDAFGVLTERQQEVLQVASFSGFFDRPQRATADDVAAILGISRSTALYHLRKAEHRVFNRLL